MSLSLSQFHSTSCIFQPFRDEAELSIPSNSGNTDVAGLKQPTFRPSPSPCTACISTPNPVIKCPSHSGPIPPPVHGNYSPGFRGSRGCPPFPGFLSSSNPNFAHCLLGLGELFLVTT